MLVVAQTFSWAQAKPSSPTVPQNSSKATIYIYRYKQFVGAALAPLVYCDDGQLARMENGRYFATTVDAGKHIFRFNDEQSGIVLQAVAGQQYFIRVDIAGGFMKGHGRLTLMDSQQGAYELTSDKLKPLDGSKVVDKDSVSIEGAHPQAPSPVVPHARRTDDHDDCDVRHSSIHDQQSHPRFYALSNSSKRACPAGHVGQHRRSESEQHIRRPDLARRRRSPGPPEKQVKNNQ